MKKILLVFVLLVTLVACNGPITEQKSGDLEKEYAEILVEYKIKHSDTKTWVEKIRVDDHDYLLFGSGLANPPNVIHSENCPCKQTTKR